MLTSITSQPLQSISRAPSVPREIAAQSSPSFKEILASKMQPAATPKAVAPTSLNDDPQRNDQDEFRSVFHRFVGETLFSQMLKAMRASQEPLPYFGGGRAEEIFQGQLDQVLSEKMTSGTPRSLSSTMFDLMAARQKTPGI
ncbi:MAG: rod-binding protein [Thermoguttaceae bacterium]